jgi:phospholipase/carboxylesterase
VFPEAPIVLGGPYGDGRAWWRLDEDAPLGRDRSDEDPPELADLRASLVELLAAVRARWNVAGDRVLLGGFSQGAMVACDLACASDAPLGALILLSGTLLAAPRWQPGMAARAGLRVLMSHGRYDGLLPFSSAERLRDLLIAAGARVDWIAFDGGHEIPPPLLESMAELVG